MAGPESGHGAESYRTELKPDDVSEDVLPVTWGGCLTRTSSSAPGGEYRLSNFLIWQAAYAEYYTTPTFWPDFDKEELRHALQELFEEPRSAFWQGQDTIMTLPCCHCAANQNLS